MTPPKLFISYSHDSSEHMERVLSLANRLREDGVDCELDQYEESPKEGWARWTASKVQTSEFVAVVCTEVYARRFCVKEEAGIGLGVAWEGAILNQILYDNAAQNIKLIPIILSRHDATYIPLILRGTTWYDVGTASGYESFYRRLTSQPRVEKPLVGKLKALPPLTRRYDFKPVRLEKHDDSSESVGSQISIVKPPRALWSYIDSAQARVVLGVCLVIFMFIAVSSISGSNKCPFGGDVKDERCVVLPANSETTLFFDQNSVYYKKARSSDCGTSELKRMKISKDPRTGACKIEFDQQVPRLTISSGEEVFYYQAGEMEGRQPGVDLYGYDYRSFECEDIDFCEKACATDPLCKAFSLGPKPIENSGRPNAYYCWLKSEINRTPKTIRSVTSGIRKSQ